MNPKKSFTRKLLKWHLNIRRELPWKETKDPYKIWLSEIILQQTRVEQGTPYYQKLITLFPTVQELANAKEDEVMRAWQGLGYYTRARNLHHAAKQIVAHSNGKFPDTYEEILKLKGVGAYTAAAVASFAFNLPHAVVDGNVFRVLSRAFGVKEEINSGAAKRIFSSLANDLLDKRDPAGFNQAIMDFGALVCTPYPLCPECFFKAQCFAFTHKAIADFPVKPKKNAVRTRWFNFLVLSDSDEKRGTGEIIIEKRNAHDIWKGLYQVPLVETAKFTKADEVIRLAGLLLNIPGKKMKVTEVSPLIGHTLTHQILRAQFIKISLRYNGFPLPRGWKKVRKENLKKIPFPKLLENYFKSI